MEKEKSSESKPQAREPKTIKPKDSFIGHKSGEGNGKKRA